MANPRRDILNRQGTVRPLDATGVETVDLDRDGLAIALHRQMPRTLPPSGSQHSRGIARTGLPLTRFSIPESRHGIPG